jgi:hypothetical protein
MKRSTSCAAITVIDANLRDRAFDVRATDAAVIAGVTIRNGNAVGGGVANSGTATALAEALAKAKSERQSWRVSFRRASARVRRPRRPAIAVDDGTPDPPRRLSQLPRPRGVSHGRRRTRAVAPDVPE